MLPSFATQSITVVEPAMVDDRGTSVPDWDAPGVETVVAGCSVQPGASAEVLAGRDAVSVRWTVYAPPSCPATALSGVRYGGVLYAVDGEPLEWPSPTGGVDHKVLLLVDWKG